MTVSLYQSGHPHGIKTRSLLECVMGDFEIRVLMSDGGPLGAECAPWVLTLCLPTYLLWGRKGKEGEPEKEMGNLQRR